MASLPRTGPIAALVLGALVPAGCYVGLPPGLSAQSGGSSAAGDDSGGGSGADDSGGEPDGPGNTDCPTAALGPVRELTAFEYDNTVQDLLHTTSSPASSFVSDAKEGLFSRNSDRVVTQQQANQYMNAAESLAEEADVLALAGCAPSSADEETTCAEQFVRTFGRRAFRRPVDDARAARYLALYDAVRSDADLAVDFEGALRVVLEAMLQSPLFLQHVEFGLPDQADADGNIPLTQYELASRLSYAVAGTLPDDALLDAAEAGELGDPDAREMHVRRLLMSQRARDASGRFFTEWLDLNRINTAAKSPDAFPEFGDELRQSMRAETTHFIEEVLYGDADGTLGELLSADFTFVDASLAALYGIDVEVAPGEMVRVDGLPDDRRGLLGQAGFLASHATSEESSPVHRGVFVRARLMCQPIPVPKDFNPMLPERMPNETPPELVERHLSDPSCAGCHKFFDPIGLGFEHYDSIGGYRTEYDGGKPIDSKGAINGSKDAASDGDFDGLAELAAKLASSAQVTDCAVEQSLASTLGASAVSACISDDIAAAFASSGGDMRELIVEIVRSDAFARRAADEPTDDSEGACQ